MEDITIVNVVYEPFFVNQFGTGRHHPVYPMYDRDCHMFVSERVPENSSVTQWAAGSQLSDMSAIKVIIGEPKGVDDC